MTELSSKVALVVGGGGGIGLGIAKAMATEGCRVALADISEDALKQAATENTGMVWKVVDATDRRSVADLFQWAESEVGPVEVVAYSAGMNVANRMFQNIDPADYDQVNDVNANGAFLCIRAALEVMRPRKTGTIINIVSLAGLRSMLLAGLPYCTSKFAQGAMGLFANQEVNADGVRVTNIYPGETNTPIVDKRPEPPPAEKRAAMLQPEDIAACAVLAAKLDARAVLPEIVVTPRHMPMS